MKLKDQLSSEESLKNAWRKINKSNANSHGISDESIEKFKNNLDIRISAISKSLRENSFQFSPTRAALLPKKDNGYRPLQIPEVSDRVVIKAIAIILEKIFEDELDPCKEVSFAYQKKLGIRQATEKIRDHINRGNYFVLEVDLKDFFGTINKDDLIKSTILPKLPDTSLNELFKQSLNQKIAGINKVPKKYQGMFDGLNKGIPQGNSLSPLLSNIYLNPFDKILISKNINLVRYADDFVILSKTKKDAEEALKISEEILEEQLNLQIHKVGKKKYRIVDVRKYCFNFLSIEHSHSSFRPSEKSVKDLLEKTIDLVKNGIRYNNLSNTLYRINWLLEGWASAFYYSDISTYSQKIDKLTNWYIYLLFDKLGFKLKDASIEKLPTKFRDDKNKNPNSISELQRGNLGIPTITELWTKKINTEKEKATDNK